MKNLFFILLLVTFLISCGSEKFKIYTEEEKLTLMEKVLNEDTEAKKEYENIIKILIKAAENNDQIAIVELTNWNEVKEDASVTEKIKAAGKITIFSTGQGTDVTSGFKE
ncbi:MAG: hypothetical protein LBT51_03650 [Fusobacteriaceae bacterium]|jgi:hypothetical protein|nr:hypothetical protein [Fusobacteriaceae bacterium]